MLLMAPAEATPAGDCGPVIVLCANTCGSSSVSSRRPVLDGSEAWS